MYTLAHLHLLLNHVPIIVTPIGLLLLALGIMRHRDDLSRVAMWFFVGGAISALPTYLTGEPAEDSVERLPGVTKAIIHAHEDAALIAAIVVGVLGVFALWSLWKFRRPVVLSKWVLMAALVGAIAGSAAMARTGLLGGFVRHTEIRSDAVPAAPEPEGVRGG